MNAPRTNDRGIRRALWASALLNLLGVFVFLPLALGYESPLVPVEAPRFYAAQLLYVIGLFGVVYAWQARASRVSRPLVLVGGVGKLGFFALSVLYSLVGDLPASMAVNATPDLVLGAWLVWWARRSPDSP